MSQYDSLVQLFAKSGVYKGTEMLISFQANQVVSGVILVLRRVLNQVGLRNKKVFVIGFNKCASSSLHTLFKSLGLPSFHGPKWRMHDDLSFLQKYDCFSDGIPRDLAELDRLFPGSKYILNVRDLKSWVFSRLSHIERAKKSNPDYNTGPKWDNTEEAIKYWIKQRNEYHLFVLSYFSDRPADLLVVNFIRDESAATRVCNFLDYKRECQRPMKNVNPGKRYSQEHDAMLKRCIEELGISERELDYDIYCPGIETDETRALFPADSSMLSNM